MRPQKILLALVLCAAAGARADGDFLLVDDPMAAEIRPADGATVEQSPPDFSWPDVSKQARYTVQLTYPDGRTRTLAAPQNYINWDEVLPAGSYAWSVTAAEGGGKRVSRARKFIVSPEAKPFVVPDMKALLAKVKAKPHPRGLPDAGTLATMAKQRPQGISQLRAEVDTRMRSMSTMPDSPSPGRDESTVQDEVKRTLNALSAAVMLKDDRYVEDAVKRVRNLASWDPEGPTAYTRRGLNTAARFMTFAMVLGYDWLHPRLDAETKRLLLGSIKARLAHMHADVIGKRSRIAAYPRDSHGNLTATMLGMMSALMAGDLPEADEWMSDALPLAINITTPFGGEDGGFSNGMAYAIWSKGQLQPYWYVTRWATGIDFAQKASVRNHARLLAYFDPPGSPVRLFGDGHEQSMFKEQIARYGKGFTYFAPSPLGRWYASQLSGEAPMRMEYLLAPPADFSGSQRLPKGTPNAHLIASTGWAAMHSDLADPKRVSVYFKSSPPPHGAFNHQHADQNGFVINAGGERLAIESGYYDGYKTPHWWNWLKATRAKNAITYDGGKGQIYFEATDYKKMGYGRITRFESREGYDIVTGDATAAYDGALKQALRTMVYLRPNLVVVYDKLASDTPRRWEWNIHALEKMKTDSDTSIRIAAGGQSLCVRMLGAAPVRFSQTSEWTAEPTKGDGKLIEGAAPRSGTAQWHGRFSTEPLRAAELVAVLDVGCQAERSSASNTGGVWSIKAADKTVSIDRTGKAEVK